MCVQAFPIILEGKVGNMSLSTLTNRRSYLRQPAGAQADDAREDDDEANGDTAYSFTLADLHHIVQYAAQRSITVVPEIDMPAHTL